MISVTDVLNALSLYPDTENFSEAQLKHFAETGLNFVKSRLRDNVDESNPLILETAAVVAHYNFFVGTPGTADRYESYKAGDMTIRRNLLKELQFEKEILATALSNAASILVDKEFCFIGS